MSDHTAVTLEPSDWELVIELLQAEVALLDRASEQSDDEIDSREWTKWSVLARQYRHLLETIDSQLGQGLTVTGDAQGWTMIRSLLEAEAGKHQMASLFGPPVAGNTGNDTAHTVRHRQLEALVERLAGHLDAQTPGPYWR
jgi:hypothetical protein